MGPRFNDPVTQRKMKIEHLENWLKAEKNRLAPLRERLSKIKELTQHVNVLTTKIEQLEGNIESAEYTLGAMKTLSESIVQKTNSLDYYSGDPTATGIAIETMQKRSKEAAFELHAVEFEFVQLEQGCNKFIKTLAPEISELLTVFKTLESLEASEIQRLKSKAQADAKVALAAAQAEAAKKASVAPPKPSLPVQSVVVSPPASVMWQPLTKDRLDKKLLATSRITSKETRAALAEILVDEKKIDIDKFCVALRDQLENPASIITKLIKHPENKQAMQQLVIVMRESGPIPVEVVKKLEADFKDQLAQDVQYTNLKNERISKLRELLKLDKIPSKDNKLIFVNIYDAVLKQAPANREIKLEELAILYSMAYDVADMQQQWIAKKQSKKEDMKSLDKLKKMNAFDELESLVQKALCQFPVKNMNEVMSEIKKMLAETHAKDGIFSKERGIKAGPMDLATTLIKGLREKLNKNYETNIVKLFAPSVSDNKTAQRFGK
jgi:cob(I)alamin adenosyltransferase